MKINQPENIWRVILHIIRIGYILAQVRFKIHRTYLFRSDRLTVNRPRGCDCMPIPPPKNGYPLHFPFFIRATHTHTHSADFAVLSDAHVLHPNPAFSNFTSCLCQCRIRFLEQHWNNYLLLNEVHIGTDVEGKKLIYLSRSLPHFINCS